jgi:hypothetical protein
MGKLITVGRKLAVLGVDNDDPTGPWHILKPGTFGAPLIGDTQTVGTALCGRWVITNGYAADFAPSHQDLCGACSERL